MKDKCGIVGIYSPHRDRRVAPQIYYALYALQHRGQESAGISTFNGEKFCIHKGMGLVYEVFNSKKLDSLTGNVGIGHVRYSTTGKSMIENSQPFYSESHDLNIAIAHNGDIINSWKLRRELKKDGYIFNSTTDSEIISHLIKREYKKCHDIIKAIKKASKQLIGSYSLVMLINGSLYVVRDPLGMKPLVLATRNDTMVAASESVAFDVIGAEYLRDVKPGEIIHLQNDMETHMMKGPKKKAHCMFEYVYFARPDSIIDGRNVYEVRLNIGRALYKEHPVDADVVMPVPDSAITAAIGYSRASGIPYGEGLIKNRYVGRTFIMPTQEERETAVKLKMNPIKSELKDKRIVLIDDSIVRGTTSKSIIDVLRGAGVKEIHLRIGCPPITSPCYYGIAMATKEELIASNKSIDEIRKILGVDSLGYLSIDSLVKCIGLKKDELCTGCLDGNYPTPLPLQSP